MNETKSDVGVRKTLESAVCRLSSSVSWWRSLKCTDLFLYNRHGRCLFLLLFSSKCLNFQPNRNDLLYFSLPVDKMPEPVEKPVTAH